MSTRPAVLLRVATLAIYLVASVSAGLAHGAAGAGWAGAQTARGPDAAALEAFRLPDGSLPVLCLAGDPAEPAGTGHRVCEACLFSAGHAAPPAAPAIGRMPRLAEPPRPPVLAAPPASPERTFARPRGPPLRLARPAATPA